MSNRPCNLCEFRVLRREANLSGKKVKLVPHPVEGFPKGQDVFVAGKFKVWYAEIPEECEC